MAQKLTHALFNLCSSLRKQESLKKERHCVNQFSSLTALHETFNPSASQTTSRTTFQLNYFVERNRNTVKQEIDLYSVFVMLCVNIKLFSQEHNPTEPSVSVSRQ